MQECRPIVVEGDGRGDDFLPGLLMLIPPQKKTSNTAQGYLIY